MRYYHYGYKSNNNYTEESDLKASGNIYIKDKAKDACNSSLVIEDDTVYEIDEECIKCRK